MTPAATLPRSYVHHSVKTVNYLRKNYPNCTMKQMATDLGIEVAKLKALARREGLEKRKSLF